MTKKKTKKEYEEKTEKVKLSTETPFFGRLSKSEEYVYFQNTDEYENITFLIDVKQLTHVIESTENYCFMNVIINDDE